MRIAVLGGGPGGLYFAALAKQLDAGHEITVWERNAADDTFGFGVVFSDETLGGIEHADQEIFAAMRREFARWDDIDVHFRGTTFTSGGHGFAAMSRKRLLAILQARCASLGVRVLFRTEAPDVAALAAGYDLVVAADGMNSATRSRFAPTFRPDLERRRCKYIWLGTDLVFDAFKFYILDTPAGIMQVHGYPYSERASTFILEMHEDVWQRAGFGDVGGASGLRARAERRGLDRDDPRPVRGRARRPARAVRQQLAVDHLQHRALPDLAARERGAARRRGAHRALLDRLGHQAGHGGRAGAGRLPARAGRRRTRRWPPTRPSGGRWSPRPSGPRRPAWSGSRTSASTPTRTRTSSRSTS